MGEGGLLIIFIVCQRIAELFVARRNTARLMSMGGVEFGRVHYFLIVALHVAWIAGLWIFGRMNDVSRPLLVLFLVLQAARVWCLLSLGRRWTTRIVILPDEPLVARGPYRFMRHPNYAIVAAEIAIVPLMLGLPVLAIVFTVANALVLFVRIREENAALEGGRGGGRKSLANGKLGL